MLTIGERKFIGPGLARRLKAAAERTAAGKHSKPKEHDSDDSTSDDSGSDDDSATYPHRRPVKVRRTALSHINVQGSAFPRSGYDGYESPLPQSDEAHVICDLLIDFLQRRLDTGENPEYTYFSLDEFSVYLPNDARHRHELVSFDRLQNRSANNEFLFDGLLSFGSERRYVKGARFDILTVEGYGDPEVLALHNHISIQSKLAQRHNVWYKLGRPSPEYTRFYKPFLWLSTFTKYFVEYLLDTEEVTLSHFRKAFYTWLQKNRQGIDFEPWHRYCGGLHDFRTNVAANVGFLWKECHSIDDPVTGLCEHPVWTEVDPFRLEGIQREPEIEPNTICTPFVYEAFRRMYFGGNLELRAVDRNIARRVATRKKALKLTPFPSTRNANADGGIPTPVSLEESSSADGSAIEVQVGDVVAVAPDEEGAWIVQSPVWFAYVQDVLQVQIREDDQLESETRAKISVIWLYEPCDTTIGKAYYPFEHELFMSDNCGCKGKKLIDVGDVIRKVDVAWFETNPTSTSGHFVRRKFRTRKHDHTYDFVSLKKDDFECSHRLGLRISHFEACRRQYVIGDTVLVRVRHPESDHEDDVLDPAQVIDFNLELERVMLRRLHKRKLVEPTARPNELALTDEQYDVDPRRVIRKCHVRFFSEDVVAEGLPVPYNRNGTGDFYFVIGQQEDSDEVSDADGVDKISLPPLGLGPDIAGTAPTEKLTGMGIFCGGGNFDRGLEDGGAVRFKYAVDYAERAIYSYRANCTDSTECFFGSVNDYLAQAMAGSTKTVIAPVGDVGFLSGGSPCPGFSLLQSDRLSQASRKNASLVASFVSFVDFYSPRYGVLENVVPMTHGMGPGKNENVFAQVLAALVGMGYQVQQFLMDAWSYGSPQSRSRVFIVASAPGLEPWPSPHHTHAHPEFRNLSLGKASNGEPFGERQNLYTPFQHVSAAEGTADLPDVADSQVQLCPAFPDHRVPSEQDANKRGLIAAIPKYPLDMGVVRAAREGLLSGSSLEWYKDEKRKSLRTGPITKSFTRVNPTGLLQTVTTSLDLHCKRGGRNLHWSQDRSLTVMEVRRAQGFPDEDVIIGSAPQQVYIVGNSVDRNVALALGLSLRGSWLKSQQNATPMTELEEEDMSDAAEVGAFAEDEDVDMDSDEELGSVSDMDEYADQARAGASSLSVHPATAVETAGVLQEVRMGGAWSFNDSTSEETNAMQELSRGLQPTPPMTESKDFDDEIVATGTRVEWRSGSEWHFGGIEGGKSTRTAFVLVEPSLD
ncbi:hypothetical protein LTR09_006111 [Extremus antarcticus]|uniref:DNA (cytosine-5-)-methyltransferase n=1 Tax=Extremus antarcticus TaxID=702011 RepID=A0AAJ0G8R5_9PEZI|nr:hypothetical protein LTR09_006111 [Extremus antarcticus]